MRLKPNLLSLWSTKDPKQWNMAHSNIHGHKTRNTNMLLECDAWLISRKWTHQITTLLFVGFGFWSLWDAFKEGETEELAEVEKELNVDVKVNGVETTKNNKDSDELKKQCHRFLAQFFSPILLKAFSITFFGEWGDKSQMRILLVLFLEESLNKLCALLLLS